MEELRYSKKRIRIYIGTLLGVILAIGLIIVCNHCVSEKKSDSKYNESIETNGSILNNIVFGGELAEESGKIYYSNANDSWSLYRKNLKGETEQKLHDNRCDNINIGKGWLFCRDVKNHQIIKMRLDGSKKQVIYKGIIDNLAYYGDYLYFLEEREGIQHIAKIRCDGSEKTYIYSNREDRICNLILVQDWIYYYSMNDKMIEKVNIDGSSNTNVVKAEMDFFIADKKGIYFADKEKQKVCYVDYDGKHLSVISNSCPRYMYIFEGQLYYCNGNDSIWKEELREDKSEKYVDKKVIQVTTENYMEVMEVIYDYPDQFAGKTIELTGFVYNDPNNKDSQFLFRFGIIHCIADSGVYGLLTTGAPQHFENNTWIHAKGTLSIEYHKQLKQSLPVLHISDCQTITKPDNPYVYRVF